MAVVALAASPVAMASGGQASNVTVNRQPISSDEVLVLEYFYGPIASGSYWYDAVSGLWGSEGGPAKGQIAPGLNLGGPLRSDASNGHTGVFFNGRQLHPNEVDSLRQMFGTVPQGRYWLRADGIGGAEGGPALFNLVAASGGSGSTARGGGNDFYNGGTIDRGYGGAYGSDGSCFYISVDGGDVMGPGC